ncbi:RsbR, positive regulator of sigma-B [Chondromyces apiculatus DSM 436]|uniref:RsbR, positive regulator of sigma-B n=1 Tax=Chondromyces apiculatus DSM 436 TaxID=1192034 RepID=A0A017SYK2_9BACT|nr:RsbR, positive regulator of sigma-B [Chondromyces apiculatus DSM 436]
MEFNETTLTWDPESGLLGYHGRRSTMFWLDPSLSQLLAPLAEELGVPLFRLTVAYHASLGAKDDHRLSIADGGGASFAEVLETWGHSVEVCGWGRFELEWFDEETGRASVRVHNPWELAVQASAKERWGCPFLFGKLVGLYSRVMGANGWADETVGVREDGTPVVDFLLYRSDRTIQDDLEALRREHDEEARQPLREKLQELWESKERQRAVLASLGEVVLTLDLEGQLTGLHVPPDQAPFHPSPKAAVGRSLEEALPWNVAVALRGAFEHVLRGEAPAPVSYEIEHEEGCRGYSAKLTALHDATGKVAGVTVLARDLTERLRTEHALEAQLAVIARQQEAIRALSTPVLQVWEGVVALPIIGVVDDRRAADITAALLETVSRTQARCAILDVTGVDSIDARTADHFTRIRRAVTLLGAECVVCGIRPAVAQAMVETSAGGSPDVGAAARNFSTMQAALQAVIGQRREWAAAQAQPRPARR